MYRKCSFLKRRLIKPFSGATLPTLSGSCLHECHRRYCSSRLLCCCNIISRTADIGKMLQKSVVVSSMLVSDVLENCAGKPYTFICFMINLDDTLKDNLSLDYYLYWIRICRIKFYNCQCNTYEYILRRYNIAKILHEM